MDGAPSIGRDGDKEGKKSRGRWEKQVWGGKRLMNKIGGRERNIEG